MTNYLHARTVRLGKLLVSKLVKKFPASDRTIAGIRRPIETVELMLRVCLTECIQYSEVIE